MAKDHSFDIVSKVDLQEVRNAVAMAQKEINNRFDFRGSKASLEYEGGSLKLAGDHEAQLKSVREVIQTKLAKRGVAMNALDWSAPEQMPSGGMKQQASLQQGISSDKAKTVTKSIRDLGLKVQARIEGETVRVTGKQIDDLQSVMQAVKKQSFGIPIQVENLR